MSTYHSRNRRDGITSRFRLREYDYSTPGYYFVTVCIEDRAHRLGVIREDRFIPSGAGNMVLELWLRQVDRFPQIELDAYCGMPNHFHGVVGIGTRDDAYTEPVGLSSIMQAFKSLTTVAYGKGVKEQGWPRFNGRLWQPGYHEHIVRNDHDLERIRTYIENNAANWLQDEFFRV